jgi:ABC-type proline/glycine betaine transport system permease subunit
MVGGDARGKRMRKVYQVLAYLVALEVVVQAAVMVWGIAGLGIWVDDGGVLDKQTFEDAFEGGATPFPEFSGLMIHGMNGMMIIPILALLLLVVSFFAKVPRGIVFALAIVGLVVLQVFLGIFGHSVSISGAAHGVNALILFSVAVMAGVRARTSTRAVPAEPSADTTAAV